MQCPGIPNGDDQLPLWLGEGLQAMAAEEQETLTHRSTGWQFSVTLAPRVAAKDALPRQEISFQRKSMSHTLTHMKGSPYARPSHAAFPHNMQAQPPSGCSMENGKNASRTRSPASSSREVRRLS